jgi:class 3 adenylate cyclase/tetratricopeptide (TPR) repeat protein
VSAAVPEPTTGASVRRHIPELALDWMLDTPEKRWQIVDGTLCFADISGFTALAERLARRGRMGGEELIGRLGGVFSAMLDLARERGGSLLKFGGDALLLFFQGPDHALQAASAAVAMRQVLREAAATPTSVGPLRLSMSVGLHAGPAHFFLVGDGHRELVLLGPAADAVVATENAAGPGEIALSPATAELLPRDAARPRDDGLPLLRWRKPAVVPCGARPQRDVPAATLAKLFPRTLGEFLAPGAPEPEHRVACIAFIKFTGTDRVLGRDGADAVARALDATLGPIQACLDAEAITLLALDVDRDGGKLFLGSGVPYAHADDEGNMLRALRRIADLELPLTLQIGVNRGHVFAAEVGSLARAAYSAMGDTTNTAARITAKAPHGQIYAHPSVLDQSLAVFEVTPSPPLTMKGKKVPLVAYQLGAQTGTRRREGLEVAEWLGRERELAIISRAIAAAQAGSGGVLCVTGETGMGKSKLIGEALARAGEIPFLFMRGEPSAEISAWALVREPMLQRLDLSALLPDERAHALLARIRHDTPELLPFAPLIGDVVGIDLPATPEVAAIEPRFRGVRTAEVLLRWLATAFTGPRFLVVDDAQWCDESSLAVMQALADACARQPWLMFVTRRPGSGGFEPDPGPNAAAPAEWLTLGPMAPEDLTRLLTIATEAAPLRPHELETLVKRSGGNPLFAFELLRGAREAGSFDAVPESLEAAMAAQVDALDPDARRVLRYASVLGRRFPRVLLAEVLRAEGQTLSSAEIDRLTDFLEAEGPERLSFRSEVICDTTYQAVSYQMRRRLHGRVGAGMERLAEDPDSIADSLALHFSRADDHSRAFRYARIAADRARERYANVEAARFYGMALDAARALPDVEPATRIELLTRLGEVQERAAMLEASLDAYARALKLAGEDPLIRANLLYARAAAKERMRAFSGALRDLRAGLRLIEAHPGEDAAQMRARLESTIAWVLYGQDRSLRALAQARRAAEEARRAGERRSLGAALVVMELAGLMVEGPGPGEHLGEALTLFQEIGDLTMQATVQANLGFLCAVAGRWQEGVGWLEVAREGFNRVGDVIRACEPALNLGEMLVKQGRLDAAEPVLLDAIRVLRAAHFVEGVNRGEIQYARILIERGDFPAAEAMLARVQQEFAEAGQHVAALEAAAVRALGRFRAGAAQEGLDLLDAARAAAGADAELLMAAVACERGRILAALARFDEARREVDAGLEAARGQGLPYEEALLLRVRGSIARDLGHDANPADEEAAQRILSGLGVV